MQKLRFSAIALLLLASCGYPLRTPPFLNGEVKGIYCPEPHDGEACAYVGAPLSENTLPARFDVRVDTWSETGYTFSGTFELNGTRYTVSGQEEGMMTEQHYYLAPQAHALAGRVTATLTGEGEDGTIYRLEGISHYGSGGGFSPVREEPSTSLYIYLPETEACTKPAPCILGALRFPVN